MRISINAFKEDTPIIDLFKIVNNNFPIFWVEIFDMEEMYLVYNIHFTLADSMDIRELFSELDR